MTSVKGFTLSLENGLASSDSDGFKRNGYDGRRKPRCTANSRDAKITRPFSSAGFTALELLIVIAVMLLLFALATVPFASFREAQVLNAAASELTALLAEARGASVASRESSEYGVHFEESRGVFFKGTAFAEPSSHNREVTLDRAIEISNIALQGGGSDVVFEMLTGETAQYGTVTLRSKANASKQKTITVGRTGAASHD